MSRRLGVLGYPVGHSISPAIQQAALDALGIDMRYERWEVAPSDLASWVDTLRAPDVVGANVTVPHKQAIIPYLDDLAPIARDIGAVNTIVKVENRLVGENTDAAGFTHALREAGYAPVEGSVVMLGAGGAARAVGYALLGLGIEALTIANRSVGRACTLAADLTEYAGPTARVEAFGLDALELDAWLAGCELLVNTTSVGMRPGERLLRPDQVPSRALVVDIVYNPPRTQLLADAAARGARTLNGLPMLVHQAALAFELWTGRVPSLRTMFAAAHEALK
jgi:shikimate dehydrogenase